LRGHEKPKWSIVFGGKFNGGQEINLSWTPLIMMTFCWNFGPTEEMDDLNLNPDRNVLVYKPKITPKMVYQIKHFYVSRQLFEYEKIQA
jgi:hypothetical protein